jgi:hypothetical protein
MRTGDINNDVADDNDWGVHRGGMGELLLCNYWRYDFGMQKWELVLIL